MGICQTPKSPRCWYDNSWWRRPIGCLMGLAYQSPLMAWGTLAPQSDQMSTQENMSVPPRPNVQQMSRRVRMWRSRSPMPPIMFSSVLCSVDGATHFGWRSFRMEAYLHWRMSLTRRLFRPSLAMVRNIKPCRQLLVLPVRNGGLGLPIPSSVAPEEFAASQYITECYVQLLLAGVAHSGEIDRSPSSGGSGESGESGVVCASGSVVDASFPLPVSSQLFLLITSSVLPSSTGMSDGSAAVVSSGSVVDAWSPQSPSSSSWPKVNRSKNNY